MLRSVYAASIALLLCACSPALPREADLSSAGLTGIAGRVEDREGNAAAGAHVYVYRSDRGGLRGPADFAAPVGIDGGYHLELVEGRYYLVARFRREGGEAGPPRRGDAWALYPRNPVTVEPGKVTRADFRLQTVTQPALMKEGTLTGGDTGFTGKLQDPKGNPVAGAFVLAYRGSDLHRMPDFVSPAADDQGHFSLFVPEGGKYCIAARAGIRGQPRTGELYGILGEGEKGCRIVGEGEVLDLGVLELSPYRQ